MLEETDKELLKRTLFMLSQRGTQDLNPADVATNIKNTINGLSAIEDLKFLIDALQRADSKTQTHLKMLNMSIDRLFITKMQEIINQINDPNEMLYISQNLDVLQCIGLTLPNIHEIYALLQSRWTAIQEHIPAIDQQFQQQLKKLQVQITDIQRDIELVNNDTTTQQASHRKGAAKSNRFKNLKTKLASLLDRVNRFKASRYEDPFASMDVQGLVDLTREINTEVDRVEQAEQNQTDLTDQLKAKVSRLTQLTNTLFRIGNRGVDLPAAERITSNFAREHLNVPLQQDPHRSGIGGEVGEEDASVQAREHSISPVVFPADVQGIDRRHDRPLGFVNKLRNRVSEKSEVQGQVIPSALKAGNSRFVSRLKNHIASARQLDLRNGNSSHGPSIVQFSDLYADHSGGVLGGWRHQPKIKIVKQSTLNSAWKSFKRGMSKVPLSSSIVWITGNTSKVTAKKADQQAIKSIRDILDTARQNIEQEALYFKNAIQSQSEINDIVQLVDLFDAAKLQFNQTLQEEVSKVLENHPHTTSHHLADAQLKAAQEFLRCSNKFSDELTKVSEKQKDKIMAERQKEQDRDKSMFIDGKFQPENCKKFLANLQQELNNKFAGVDFTCVSAPVDTKTVQMHANIHITDPVTNRSVIVSVPLCWIDKNNIRFVSHEHLDKWREKGVDHNTIEKLKEAQEHIFSKILNSISHCTAKFAGTLTPNQFVHQLVAAVQGARPVDAISTTKLKLDIHDLDYPHANEDMALSAFQDCLNQHNAKVPAVRLDVKARTAQTIPAHHHGQKK